MRYLLIIPYYFSWHYGRGFKELIVNSKNLAVFVLHLFSIRILLSTLFSPFQRLKSESNGSGLNMEDMLGNIVVNLIMRLLGFLMRIVVIIIGLISFIIAIALMLISWIIWLALPFIIIFLFFSSLIGIIKNI